MLTRKKHRLHIVDLYSGVGGLSLGAARAGFNVKAAVEMNRIAADTHKLNFPHATHILDDVSILSGAALLKRAELASSAKFGVIGGPPCQGFSDAGRRDRGDPRNSLISEFFRVVAEARPVFFMAENVPGILDIRNSSILSSALARIPDNYVVLDPMIINASDYGAPTSRKRVFFIGFDPQRSDPLNTSDFSPSKFRDVRVKDAMRNLPRIRSNWQREEQSWRVVGTLDQSEYAIQIQGNIPKLVGDPRSLDAFKKDRMVSGFLGTRHQDKTIRRFSALRHGQRDTVSKAVRLDPDGYCPTLLAGTGPERGSYQALRPVHHSSPRVIAPREGARLQGFPDWFQFHPTKWHAFSQIGNSVSPIVAEALLAKVAEALR